MKPITADAYNLFHAGQLTLAQIEGNGMRIDTAYLDRAIVEVSKKVEALKQELANDQTYSTWSRLYGSGMNLGSRAQLAVVLKNLGYGGEATLKTKRMRTDKAALADIDLPFLKTYQHIQRLEKLRSTNLEGIRNELVDGILHPFFSLTTGDKDKDDETGGAASWRSSSSMPNCQNWPTRDSELAEYVRRALIPRGLDWLIAELDFKGIEVAVAACATKDPQLIKYVSDPTTDMHRDMAWQIYCMSEVEMLIAKFARYCAKNRFVFPEFYGSFFKNCAKALWDAIPDIMKKDGIDVMKRLRDKGIKELGDTDFDAVVQPGTFVAHLQAIEDDFWGRRFRVYQQWKDIRWAEYQRDGFFDLLTGFRAEGVFSKRQVRNFPIQGPAFHLDLWFIIEMQKWLNKNLMKSLLIGEVHDSGLGDIHKPELQDFLNKAEHLVTTGLLKAFPWICVPLKIEVEVSDKSWYDKKPWIKKSGRWQPAKAA